MYSKYTSQVVSNKDFHMTFTQHPWQMYAIRGLFSRRLYRRIADLCVNLWATHSQVNGNWCRRSQKLITCFDIYSRINMVIGSTNRIESAKPQCVWRFVSRFRDGLMRFANTHIISAWKMIHQQDNKSYEQRYILFL